MNDNRNINPEGFISARQDTFKRDRSIMLTQGENLVNGMPYRYSEGSHSAAVRLAKAWHEDDISYLNVEELKSTNTLII